MNWNDNWDNGVNTHADIEAAIKAKIQEIQNAIASGDATMEQVGLDLATLQSSINNLVPKTRKINNKPLSTDVTLKTSDLENDSGYITDDDLPEGVTVDEELDDESGNAISNAAVCEGLASKANAADVYTKAQTIAAIQDAVEDIEAGETVVVNSDGANIVDEHDNNSVLLAPSARQMKLMYDNVMAIYNGLANIAFTNGKPTLDWIGSKTKYTLSYGTLTGCTADVAAGQVNEGGLRIKLTPTSSSYAFTSVLVNGESVATTPANDGLGSVYVDIVVNDDITLTATAVSGFSVVPATGSHFSLSNGSVSAGGTYNGILQPESNYDLPATISATMGGSPITFDGTNNSYDEETGAIKISGVNGNIVITASMTIQDSVVVTLPNDANIIIKHGNDTLSGSVEIFKGMTPYSITFQPKLGYHFTNAPTASNGHAISNSGNVYTLEISAADTAGRDFSVSAATELAQMLNVTLPNDAGVVVEDGEGNVLTGTPTVEEGGTFVCVVRCVAGKQFASGGTPAISGASSTVQADGSYRLVVNNVSAAITITATSESVTEFTGGDINYVLMSNPSEVKTTVKSGTDSSNSSANTGDKYTGAIVVPATVTHDGATYSVKEIGDCTFCNCSGVTSATLPEGLTKIGKHAFRSCSSLQSCNMPTTLTRIGGWAFQDADLRSLEFLNTGTLTIGGGENSVFNGGLKNCQSLQFNGPGNVVTGSSMYCFNSIGASLSSPIASIFIPKKVSLYGGNFQLANILELEFEEGTTSIPFQYGSTWNALKTVILPSSITEVQYYNFGSNVNTLVCKAVNPPTINTNNNPSFVNYNMDIYVPEVAVNDYKNQGADTSDPSNNSGWSKYANIHPLSEYPGTL
jgi:hypothetical protein